jgi:hypothetical protein
VDPDKEGPVVATVKRKRKRRHKYDHTKMEYSYFARGAVRAMKREGWRPKIDITHPISKGGVVLMESQRPPKRKKATRKEIIELRAYLSKWLAEHA